MLFEQFDDTRHPLPIRQNYKQPKPLKQQIKLYLANDE